MIHFDFNPVTRIVFGPGKIDQIGALAVELGATRVLMVSDPGIIAAGHPGRALASLRKAGVETHLFDGVTENPTTENVEAGRIVAAELKPDLLIGLGGGSSMDCAKGINFVHTGGGRMQDYWGVGKATQPMLAMIAVPTTAGTGSETQSFALISDAETHQKMACGDKKAACRIALLDPELTLTQPREVAAMSAIDAVAHALETYVTKPRNPFSQLFSRKAWELLSQNFSRVFSHPDDVEARGAMLLGASLAGLAIENSMLGATHSCANPVTARNGTIHGRVIGIMLPHVIRKNSEVVGELYGDLLHDFRSNGAHQTDPGQALAAIVESFLQTGGLPSRLRDCGIDRGALGEMARQASEQWTAQFNPRDLSESEFEELYNSAY